MKYFKTTFTIETGVTDNSEIMATARELCAAIAGYTGYESFEDTENGLNGYVQQELFNEEALRMSLSDFPLEGVTVRFETSVAEDKNWNEQWEKEGFAPIIFDKRCIIHDIYHATDNTYKYPVDIEIDAKLAFGTGTHNTTRMIVEQLLNMDIAGKRVLDCGCGTGILSIVASKCGAKEVIAYDIDEWSVENSIHNATINSVKNMDVIHGNVTVLNNIEGTFDIVLANINRNILLNDMTTMVTKMHHDTIFVISGFYTEDIPMLKDKAEQSGLEYVDKKSSDNWSMVVFRKI